MSYRPAYTRPLQVVTHLCYSDFGDIMHSIAEMDGESVA